MSPASPPRGGKRPRTPEDGRKQRRALTNVGGETMVRGDAAFADALGHALHVAADEDATRAHVHGFHSYPARMHPQTAARLVRAFSPERGTVLDPFCGSGTVLVEGRLAGRAMIGSDLSPLAARLAELKAAGRDKPRRDELRRAVARVVEKSEERTRQRVGASRRYDHADVAAFAPHVLLELDGLRVAVDEESPEVRSDLGLVLSSILTKVERRSGDSARDLVNKRVPRHFATNMFARRFDELLRQLAQYEKRLPDGAPLPRVLVADARDLSALPDASVDLVVTSPPYPGTYDYKDHHETRMRWLGLDAQAFGDGEIGTRRAAQAEPHKTESRWLADFHRVLAGLGRVLRPDGKALVLIGDSTTGDHAIRNDRTTERAAEGTGLGVLAMASQPRPHFHGPSARAFLGAPRMEHLVLLGRSAAPRARRVVG